MKFILIISLFISTLVYANVESNKKLVKDFYEMAFNEHKPIEAMKKYAGRDYIQHNPYVASGQKPFIEYFKGYFKENPKAQVEIKRIIAEGDMVVLHALSKKDKADRGHAVIDIFRIKDNKIVEHWDAVQDVPAKSANDNTMF